MLNPGYSTGELLLKGWRCPVQSEYCEDVQQGLWQWIWKRLDLQIHERKDFILLRDI